MCAFEPVHVEICVCVAGPENTPWAHTWVKDTMRPNSFLKQKIQKIINLWNIRYSLRKHLHWHTASVPFPYIYCYSIIYCYYITALDRYNGVWHWKRSICLIDFFSRLFYVFTEEKLLILHSLTMRGRLFEPFLSVSDVILVSLVHC